jgi:hypothetical protein
MSDLFFAGSVPTNGSMLVIFVVAIALSLLTWRALNLARESDVLSVLPVIYYGLAIICGAVLLFATIVNFDKFSYAEAGAMIGYTVGSVLSMFAVGRVIQLLQQIRDK